MEDQSKSHSPFIIAVASGKGGVGKSVICANLSVALADMGRIVTLIDADMGAANLHTLFGIRRIPSTLGDYFQGLHSNLSDVAFGTPIPGLNMICGSHDSVGGSQVKFFSRTKAIRELQSLDSDIVVIDLGAGVSIATIDFFNRADRGLVISTPEPTAIENLFSFIRMALLRKLYIYCSDPKLKDLLDRVHNLRRADKISSFRLFLTKLKALDSPGVALSKQILREYQPKYIFNLARNQRDLRIANRIKEVCQQYLSVRLDLLGVIAEDPTVRGSVYAGKPLLRFAPKSPAAKGIRHLAKIIHNHLPVCR